MNTQSHFVLNIFFVKLFYKKNFTEVRYLNSVILFGSILPDLPIVLFFLFYTIFSSVSQETIWGTLYFQDNWQIFFNLFNSIPIFLIVAIISYWLKKPRLCLFSLANLLHFIEDFFLHNDDAHAHFFPLSSYTFQSPLSYWDPKNFGVIIAIIENVIILVLSVLLWKYFKKLSWKIILVIANLMNISGYVMWYLIFGFSF